MVIPCIITTNDHTSRDRDISRDRDRGRGRGLPPLLVIAIPIATTERETTEIGTGTEITGIGQGIAEKGTETHCVIAI